MASEDRLPKGKPAPLKQWLSAFDDPELVLRPVLDGSKTESDANGACSLYDGLASYFRVVRRLKGYSEERKDVILRRLIEQATKDLPPQELQAILIQVSEGFQEVAAAAIQAQHADVRDSLSENEEPLTEEEQESLERLEWQFVIRVGIPCLFLHQRWPHHLLRDVRRGSLDATLKLLRIDKRVQYHLVVAEFLTGYMDEVPRAYRNRVSKAIAAKIPRLTKRNIKLSLFALTYEVHKDMPEAIQRFTVGELKSLFDLVDALKNKDLGRLDEDIPPEESALFKALEARRAGWRKLIDDSLEDF